MTLLELLAAATKAGIIAAGYAKGLLQARFIFRGLEDHDLRRRLAPAAATGE